MIRRRRPPSNVWSISCTDAEWETVRRYAGRHGMSISRWFVECGLKGDPDTLPRPSERLVLSEAEQRGLYDSLTSVAARMALSGSEEAVLERIRNSLAFLVEERMSTMLREGREAELRAHLSALFGARAAEATIASLKHRRNSVPPA